MIKTHLITILSRGEMYNLNRLVKSIRLLMPCATICVITTDEFINVPKGVNLYYNLEDRNSRTACFLYSLIENQDYDIYTFLEDSDEAKEYTAKQIDIAADCITKEYVDFITSIPYEESSNIIEYFKLKYDLDKEFESILSKKNLRWKYPLYPFFTISGECFKDKISQLEDLYARSCNEMFTNNNIEKLWPRFAQKHAWIDSKHNSIKLISLKHNLVSLIKKKLARTEHNGNT